MKRTPGSLKVTKPVAAWNKPLKADFRKLFVSLTKAAAHGFTGKWVDLTGDAAAALAAIGLETDPGQLAWGLIRNALTQAIWQLVEDNADELRRHPQNAPVKFCKTLDLSLDQAQLTIDHSFFERPGDFPLLSQIRKPFEQWLCGHGFSTARATTSSRRLGSYFVFALNQEWRTHAKVYAPLRDALETPFTRATDREQAWVHYAAWLQKQADESVFGESFSLRQIYVPLRAYYHRRSEKDEGTGRQEDLGRTLGQPAGTVKVVVDLEKEILAWVQEPNPPYPTRVISGGPGSGKSCFSKMCAAVLSNSGAVRVLYIPLHQFDPKQDLVDSVGRFVRQSELLVHNPLAMDDGGEERLLVIFDGLDELAMQGKVGTETAKRFVEEVDRTVRRLNLRQVRLQVLISGRELVVQGTEDEFRQEAQILHILPYHIPDEAEGEYEDPEGLLTEDQRQAWWQHYGAAIGEPYDGMPKELSHPAFQELTSQPLLNYLVAVSLRRGKLDFSHEVNLNLIYQDLLEAVYERGYEKGRPYRAIQPMKEEDFTRVLEEIALSSWHGDGRTTTVKDIQKHCKASGLLGLLEAFQEGAAAGVTRLLSAFYFRRHGTRHDGEQTFEFTHKSFGEYLTGRRIVHGIDYMVKELRRRQQDPYTAWDESDCLQHWARLCGPTRMDEYMYDFLCRQVQVTDHCVVADWQDALSRLVGFMLRHGMPMDRIAPRPTYLEETRQARNAEEALLVVLNACARVLKRMTRIEWPNPVSAGGWVRALQGQREGPENTLALRCLSLMDMKQCSFHVSDLYEADLSQSDLGESGLILANCATACFTEANLANAELYRANLSGARMMKADLTQAGMMGADLQQADLRKATLRDADLRDADLRKADLRGADLREAELRKADLRGADLREADLRKADLREADLRKARLDAADLRGADLRKAKLRGARLRDAKLHKALVGGTLLAERRLGKRQKRP